MDANSGAIKHFCLNCFQKKGKGKSCSFCGYHVDSLQFAPLLPLKTMLSGRYVVGARTEDSSDGIDYRGYDLLENRRLHIREFLPTQLAAREDYEVFLKPLPSCEERYNECKNSFFTLWSDLSKVKEISSVYRIYDVFLENNTVYVISEYQNGIKLGAFLKTLPGGYLNWEQARPIFMPVLHSLNYLHSTGIIHRGISADTLFICQDGQVRLTGFSIYQGRTAKGFLEPQLFPGYSAIEQYGFEGLQGTWTDVYSLAAVMFKALTGKAPTEATDRLANDKLSVPSKIFNQIPTHVVRTLGNALQILPKNRTRTMGQLIFELSEPHGKPVVRDEHMEKSDVVASREEPQKQKSKKTIVIAALLSGLILILAFLMVFFIVFKGSFSFDNLFQRSSNSPASHVITAETFAVPDLVGRKIETVNNDIELQRLFAITVTEVYDEADSGIIVAQSIAPETRVERKTELKISVSKGVELVKLPDVTSLIQKNAVTLLEEAGFDVKIATVYNDKAGTEGYVSRMSLTPGDAYPKGTLITIYVWGSDVSTSTSATQAP